MNSNLKMVLISLVIGVVLTLATGLVNTPPQLLGATGHGLPLAWTHTLVTYPPATTYSYLNLVIDIVIWTVIVWIIWYLVKRFKK